MPVVVNPLTDSNNASLKRKPSIMYGAQPYMMATNQRRLMVRMPEDAVTLSGDLKNITNAAPINAPHMVAIAYWGRCGLLNPTTTVHNSIRMDSAINTYPVVCNGNDSAIPLLYNAVRADS